MYLQGRLNLDDPISREIELSEINKACKDLEDGEIARGDPILRMPLPLAIRCGLTGP